ncbi:MAG: cation diffusion facilitator family transporter [Blastocatellia bacterium]|nr:cation diffusion facilitator family transporter [Blastocatellia bacterium]
MADQQETFTSARPVSRQVQNVLLWLLIANLAVVIAKAVAGWLASSLSVMSDAAHSLTDSLNNIAGIILIRFAAQPADYNHPYGHNKIEQIGAFGISGLMLFTAYEIGREAVVGWWQGTHPTVNISLLTIGVMVGTLGINLAVVFYERYQGKRLNSVFLTADAQHTMSDVYVTLGVLSGLLFVKLGFLWVDRVVALLVVCAIVYGAFQVVLEAGSELMDTVAVQSAELETLALGISGVAQVREVRSRGRGENGFVELTILVNHNDLRQAHQTSEDVEEVIRRTYNLRHITIHIEPLDERTED